MEEVKLPQGTIRYRDSGAGEPIVFVHGLLVNGSHPIPMNSDADLSAPGLAKIVADFLEALGLEKVTLVGNDSGGAISQLVATKHPQRVGRLVLTNCDAYDNFPPKLFSYFKPTARIPGAMTVLAQSMRIKPLRRTPLAFGVLTKSRIGDDLLEDWLRPAIGSSEIRRDAAKFIRGSSPKQTEQAARELASFDAPTLFAWAPEDRWFKVEHAERLASSMPDARVERIPNSKTFVSIDQPERLAELIASFSREPKSTPA
jgi:pimeloyl-ACP methyl ester carboxylesterase